jgi:hypothetical protein
MDSIGLILLTLSLLPLSVSILCRFRRGSAVVKPPTDSDMLAGYLVSVNARPPLR